MLRFRWKLQVYFDARESNTIRVLILEGFHLDFSILRVNSVLSEEFQDVGNRGVVSDVDQSHLAHESVIIQMVSEVNGS